MEIMKRDFNTPAMFFLSLSRVNDFLGKKPRKKVSAKNEKSRIFVAGEMRGVASLSALPQIYVRSSNNSL